MFSWLLWDVREVVPNWWILIIYADHYDAHFSRAHLITQFGSHRSSRFNSFRQYWLFPDLATAHSTQIKPEIDSSYLSWSGTSDITGELLRSRRSPPRLHIN